MAAGPTPPPPPSPFPLAVAAVVGLDVLVGADGGANAIAHTVKIVALAHSALHLCGGGGSGGERNGARAPLLLMAFAAAVGVPAPLLAYLERQGAAFETEAPS